jgi:hypothetical protein
MRRLGLSTLWTAAFLTPIILSLAARVPNVLDRPLVTERPDWRAKAILMVQDLAAETPTYRLTLRSARPDALVRHGEIHIACVTYGRRLSGAEVLLVFPGTRCRYGSGRPITIRDNRTVTLTRNAECDPYRKMPSDKLELIVRLPRAGDVGVWTWIPASTPAPEDGTLQVVGIPGFEQVQPLLRGRLVDRYRPTGHRRIDLLAHLWQLAPGPRAIWLILVATGALLVAGLALISSAGRHHGHEDRHTRLGSAAGGVGLLALAVALLYAILVPPFQAPDEPDHLLSFAEATEQPELVPQAAAWARLGHFERLKFHTEEKFRPIDLLAPFPVAWSDHVHAEPVTARSPVTTAFWNVLARWTRGQPLPRTLLAARGANALAFALAVALATLLVSTFTNDAPTVRAAIPYVVVPTLPFFATHLSEFAVLTSVYILLAACITVLTLDTPRGHHLGLPLGLVTAVVAASGRSAGPIVAVVAAALLCRILLGTRGTTTSTSALARAALFWGGWGLGVLGWVALSTPAYRALVSETAHRSSALSELATWVDHPAASLLVLAMLGCAGELLVSFTRVISGRLGLALSNAWVPPVAYAILLAGLGSVASSALLRFPVLAPLGTPDARTADAYAREVLLVMATSLRVGPPDLLLVTSFWGAFGWIDTLLHPILVTGMVLATAAAGAVLLLEIARARDGRRLVALGLLAGGLVLSLGLYAASAHAMSRNLHGRYLIGWYLTVIAVAWSAGLAPGEHSAGRETRRVRPADPRFLVALGGAIHATALLTILWRYF